MQLSRTPVYIKELLTGSFVHRFIRRYSTSRSRVFRSIYRSDYWNHGLPGESRSGEGSTRSATANVRRILETIFAERDIHSFLDAPCGDWNWMQLTDLKGVRYTGADIVPEVIAANTRRFGGPGRSFMVLDIVEQAPPAHDLIMCRDCIQHLSDAEIRKVLAHFSRSGSKYLLITTTPTQVPNRDIIRTGDFRPVNLRLPPWNIRVAEEEYVDFESDHPGFQKHMLLLRLPLPENG